MPCMYVAELRYGPSASFPASSDYIFTDQLIDVSRFPGARLVLPEGIVVEPSPRKGAWLLIAQYSRFSNHRARPCGPRCGE
jgi:hypothetical protein